MDNYNISSSNNSVCSQNTSTTTTTDKSDFTSTTSRSVSFSERKPRIHKCLHLSDYTASEISACFYDNYDVYDFKMNAKETSLLEDKDIDNISNSRRGTEQFQSDRMKSRIKKTRRAVTSVLMEQDLWGDDEAFHEMIAFVYQECVMQSSKDARIRGIQDEQDAQEVNSKDIASKNQHSESDSHSIISSASEQEAGDISKAKRRRIRFPSLLRFSRNKNNSNNKIRQ